MEKGGRDNIVKQYKKGRILPISEIVTILVLLKWRKYLSKGMNKNFRVWNEWFLESIQKTVATGDASNVQHGSES